MENSNIKEYIKLISDYVSINNVKVINYSEEATDLNFDFYDKKGQIGTVDLSIDYIEISFNNTVYYSLLDAIDLNELQKVLISILDCSYKIITVSKGKQRIKKKYVLTDITSFTDTEGLFDFLRRLMKNTSTT